ncbi:MAG TPA: serine/threonine-protein kinase, partial [Nannocystaceae bacterium]|nr:serine/threonine-protein kinase [Nannocystaceae bacterium]
MSAVSEDRSDDPTIQPTLRGDGDSTAQRRARTPGELPRGATVGRYVVLARVGAGTMGVVYAAYDPHLDRRVALKLLTASRTGGTEGRARTFTEAQSLARLTHPNVVAVHDVGKIELGEAEAVFLAMEFIEGRTLKEWLAEAKRPWADVLEVFLQAGHGLAAAHATGMIHRDFKPDNVMITSAAARRVVVMDFGLAQVLDLDEARASTSAPADAQLLLTLTGKLVGTPAYMPPEAYREDQKQLGPWSDQFSFCVALYEAVYGQRPFVADSLLGQMRAVTSGPPREVPRGSGVPGWLHALIVRGMRAEPGERHASMAALLAALESGRDRGR